MYVHENVQKFVTPHHLKAFTKQSKNVKQIIPHGISKKDHHAGSTCLNEVSHISREEEYWLQYRSDIPSGSYAQCLLRMSSAGLSTLGICVMMVF
jgi:hypothetical protein